MTRHLSDYSKESKDIVLDLVNSTLPEGVAALTHGMVDVAYEPTEDPQRTYAVVTSKTGSGYRGEVRLAYNRVPLSDIPKVSENILETESNTLGDIFAEFNVRYGTNISQDEVIIDGRPLSEIANEDLAFSSHDVLVLHIAAASSYVWVGEANIQIKPLIVELNNAVKVRGLDGLYAPSIDTPSGVPAVFHSLMIVPKYPSKDIKMGDIAMINDNWAVVSTRARMGGVAQDFGVNTFEIYQRNAETKDMVLNNVLYLHSFVNFNDANGFKESWLTTISDDGLNFVSGYLNADNNVEFLIFTRNSIDENFEFLRSKLSEVPENWEPNIHSKIYFALNNTMFVYAANNYIDVLPLHAGMSSKHETVIKIDTFFKVGDNRFMAIDVTGSSNYIFTISNGQDGSVSINKGVYPILAAAFSKLPLETSAAAEEYAFVYFRNKVEDNNIGSIVKFRYVSDGILIASATSDDIQLGSYVSSLISEKSVLYASPNGEYVALREHGVEGNSLDVYRVVDNKINKIGSLKTPTPLDPNTGAFGGIFQLTNEGVFFGVPFTQNRIFVDTGISVPDPAEQPSPYIENSGAAYFYTFDSPAFNLG